MIVKIIAPQRLLNHQQLELIESLQVVDVIHGVGRVRIAAQQNIWPARPHPFQNIQVPTRFYFQFDSAISGANFGFYFSHQLLDRILDPDRHPALNFRQNAPQQFPQRLLLEPRFQVPHCILDRCLGHAVLAHLRHQRNRFRPRLQTAPKHRRRQVMLDSRPGCLNPL